MWYDIVPGQPHLTGSLYYDIVSYSHMIYVIIIIILYIYPKTGECILQHHLQPHYNRHLARRPRPVPINPSRNPSIRYTYIIYIYICEPCTPRALHILLLYSRHNEYDTIIGIICAMTRGVQSSAERACRVLLFFP